MTYGDRLGIVREQHKLTMKAMAQSVGVSPSTWSKYEKDESFPSEETVLNFISIYHVNKEWLNTEEGQTYVDAYKPGDPLGKKIDYAEYQAERIASITGWATDMESLKAVFKKR